MIITELGDQNYKVQSDRKKPLYLVRHALITDLDTGQSESKWVCECKAFEYGDGKNCKHITAVLAGHFDG